MIFSFSLAQTVLFCVAAFIVLFFPGLVWVVWSYHDGRDWIERIADALALSISIIAITGMIFFFFGFQFSWLFIFISFAICFLLIILAFLKKQVQIRRFDYLIVIGFLFVLSMMVFWRFYQARTLSFPAWVDSVHHVLVVQKILDAKGISGTLAPELPIQFTYHYGFHIITALWSALTKLQPVDSVLWLGQVLNAFIGLGIYRVAKQYWKDTRIAIFAALLVTFAFQMPGYYLTWGRYTLITGLLVMLPAMGTSIEIVYYHFRWEVFIRLVILTAGLALIHYMALLFFGIFVGSLVLAKSSSLLFIKGNFQKTEAKRIMNLCLGSLLGIVFALPWLIRMLNDQISIGIVNVNIPNWNDFKNSMQYIWYLLGPKHNYWLFGISSLGLFFAWFQKKDRGLVLWATIMILLSVPWGLKLGPFRPDHMAIVLFIPAAWLLANGLINVLDALFARVEKKYSNVTLILVAISVLIWGGWQTRNILNPVTILADQSDRLAMQWIEKNVPQNARFFTNTTPWQFNTYRGVDGGYWITPMLKRFSLAMPSLYAYGKTEQKEEWKQWISEASKINSCDQSFTSLVKDAKLNYLCIHEQKGSLQPKALENCKNVTPVYIYDGVWIYQMK